MRSLLADHLQIARAALDRSVLPGSAKLPARIPGLKVSIAAIAEA